jgi:hypothetical protein
MKAYGIQIAPYIIKYNSAIRDKSSIIKLLINIVRVLIVWPMKPLENLVIEGKEDEILLILNIQRMSRVFICENNKIHTFQFPFDLTVSDEKIKIYYNYIELNSGVLTILSNTFAHFNDDQSIEKILDDYWVAIDDFEINKEEAEIYSGLITYLLSFEPGYLRFDYDDRPLQNHPLNHLDVYYTNKNTFKIGVQSKLDYKKMIAILDTVSPCLMVR